eukprot:scaffold126651_cov61-Attheya_sp.AAC.2
MTWTCPDCPMENGLGYPKRTNTVHYMYLSLINKCDQGKERKELLTDGSDKGIEFFRVTTRGGTWGDVGWADQIDNENDAFFVLRIGKGIMDFGIVKSQWAGCGIRRIHRAMLHKTGVHCTHEGNVFGQVQPTRMHSHCIRTFQMSFPDPTSKTRLKGARLENVFGMRHIVGRGMNGSSFDKLSC